ncbi:MAG TPA: TRAP transporter large permease subunit, partial [Thiolinea sp.]|nr:TRAP transporter large permease subunit [Thiolinea sp.]
TTWYVAKKGNYPREQPRSWGERWDSFRKAIWGLLLIVVVMGGIYSGLFTPTEAAAMSAVYAFFIAVFVYKDLGMKDVPRVLLNSANMSAMLLYIITNAVLFSFILTNEQIPQGIAEWLTHSGVGMIGFLIAVNILLLVMGSFMEPSSIILITAPILFPIATKLGIDPIHFGVMITVNMEVGMITPPVGLNLFVTAGVAQMSMMRVVKAAMPWLAIMFLFLIIVTYIPWISTWLPVLMMGPEIITK